MVFRCTATFVSCCSHPYRLWKLMPFFRRPDGSKEKACSLVHLPLGAKDLTVISGQHFFIVTVVAKQQDIIKQLFETFWDLIFHFADAQWVTGGSWNPQVLLSSSQWTSSPRLAGLWVVYWGCAKGRGCYCKHLHPRWIIVVGEKRMIFVYCSFSKTASTARNGAGLLWD